MPLDLSKAFDLTNHNLLLAKQELYGLRGKIHMWLSSYLTDRTQFVEIQHVDQKTSNLMSYSSSLREIKHDVPQGSVLRHYSSRGKDQIQSIDLFSA
jgi:hypothetical protein